MKPVLASLAVLALSSLTVAQTTQPAAKPIQSVADPERSSVTTEGIVNAPAEVVWRVFSTPEGYKQLGVAKARMDFRVGGMIWSSYDPNAELGSEASIGQEILGIDPGRALIVRIVHPPKGFPFTTAYKTVSTVITLADLGDQRTNVRITMSGYDGSEESQKMREFFRTGNAYVLKTLQSAHGAGEAPSGAAHADGPLDAIELSQVINAPRKEVFKTYTTAAGWKAFFNQEADIGQLPGENFVPFKGTEGNTILAVVPGEMFSYTWNAPAKFPFAKEHRTWVVLQFESISPQKTRVRVRHLGFSERAAKHPDHAQEYQEVRSYFVKAWPMVLGALAKHFDDRAVNGYPRSPEFLRTTP